MNHPFSRTLGVLGLAASSPAAKHRYSRVVGQSVCYALKPLLYCDEWRDWLRRADRSGSGLADPYFSASRLTLLVEVLETMALHYSDLFRPEGRVAALAIAGLSAAASYEEWHDVPDAKLGDGHPVKSLRLLASKFRDADMRAWLCEVRDGQMEPQEGGFLDLMERELKTRSTVDKANVRVTKLLLEKGYLRHDDFVYGPDNTSEPKTLNSVEAEAAAAGSEVATSRSADAVDAKTRTGSVVLYGPHEAPVVNDHDKPTLTYECYRVVKALVDAGNRGRSLAKLQELASSARRILKRLCDEDEDWREVIWFPGGKGRGGYRIV